MNQSSKTPNFDRLMAELPRMSKLALERLAGETGRLLERELDYYNDHFILDNRYEATYKARLVKPKALLATIYELLAPGYIDECLREQQALVAA